MKTSVFSLSIAALLAACAPSNPMADAAPDSAAPSDGGAVVMDSSAPDAAVPDGGPCSQYQGSAAWTARLAVEPGARLCAYPARQWASNPGESQAAMKERLLREAFAQKSTITIAAGSHALPTASEDRAFLLPMCVEDRGVAAGAATASARVQTSEGSGIGSTPDGPNVEATFMLGAEPLALRINRTAAEGATANLRATAQDAHYRGVNIVRGTSRLYASCALAANRCTTLAFGAAGSLRMDEHYWQAMPGFGFSAPVRLRGALDGVAVDVSAYDDMAAIYARHAFERALLFRFSAPIRGACALRVNVSDLGDPTTAQLTSCEGVAMGAPLAVTSSMTSCS